MVIFDFENQRYVFKDPEDVIVAYTIEEVTPCLEKIQTAVHQGLYAAGYIAYEAAPAFDPNLSVKNGSKIPLLWFGLFQQPSDTGLHINDTDFQFSQWVPSIGKREYQQRIEAIKHAIEKGETYQVNYTLRLHSSFTGSDLSLYQHLLTAQQGKYSAYLDIGQFQILSVSPELFFKVENGCIKARPMKGTAKRGRWLEEDAKQAEWLFQSEKNRAENVMIVDLLRNDIGKIAETGSVAVDELFTVEKYPTVLQMVSSIKGKLLQDVTMMEIFAALFPCGSITGAPKTKTMEWITILEDSPREVYCGTIGLIKPDGDMIFNVAIRTLLLHRQAGTAEYGVGGGITWDSTAAGEYEEAILKAAVVTEPAIEFQLLETIKLDHGRYFLLDHHLNRLKQSALYFDIPIAEEEILSALHQHAELYQNEARRIRLLVAKNGHIQIESVPLHEFPKTALPVRIAKNPVSRLNRFLYHKTTSREMYDTYRRENPDVFDVLLWNEEGEITEFTFGNVVVEIGNKKLTPPRESGLLSGTFREYLLEAGAIEEQVLTWKELEDADQIWFINSVREWVPVYIGN